MRRVGPCSTARPFRLACAVLCRRHGCRPAGARSRMRRALRAMRMALNMPVAAFDGVSLWLMPGEAGDEDALAVVLKHRDPALTAGRGAGGMACLGPGARCPAFACGTARIFHHRERATRPASRRASAPPPSPTERFEDQATLNTSQARNRQNYKRDADPSRRTRNYREPDFRLERRSSLFAALELHCAGLHNQLDVVGIHFAQNKGCVGGADLPCAEFVDDAKTRWAFSHH